MKNIKDLSKRIAKNNNIPEKDAKTIIEDVFGEIKNILVNEGEEVRIKNFATFKFGKTPGRVTKHPTTKKQIIIGEKRNIKLRLSTKMKKSLNQGE